MRAIWKGAVSFGLVSVPVKLYSATESHDISFRQVHAKDGGRIKYQRVCSIDGEEVPYAEIAKGYETEDGEMVILDDEDLAELPANSSREISVEKFVPSDQIDPMMFEKSYYLEPEKSGLKPYALLRDALRESDRVAVVTVSLRTRMTPALLRVRDDVLVMQTLMWPDEIRTADFGSLKDVQDPKPQELEMARLLLLEEGALEQVPGPVEQVPRLEAARSLPGEPGDAYVVHAERIRSAALGLVNRREFPIASRLMFLGQVAYRLDSIFRGSEPFAGTLDEAEQVLRALLPSFEDPEALEATRRLILAWLRSKFSIEQNAWTQSQAALRDGAAALATITVKES